jgi:hypothetical protein
MIAFEISIDGEKRCTAGVIDLGVVTVIAAWARRTNADPTDPTAFGKIEEELTLDVGGLSHDPDGAAVQLRWLRETVRPGQRITLTILQTDTVDTPEMRREDPVATQRKKREYYEMLRREYGEA